ncbi:unnamed protein product [Rhodiola kirilowii]
MRTRNSATTKPGPQPKTRRTAAKASPTVSTPDVGPKPRETKRQAAIKAKQAKISDDTTPPKKQPEDDADDDANVGDDAGEAALQASSSGKTGAKKGTKRTRGPAKGNLPAAQRVKVAEGEDTEEEEKSLSGNEDVEMTENVIEIQGKGDSVTKECGEMNADKEDAPSVMVTNEELNKEATEMDSIFVNNVCDPADACVEEEPKKETIEMKDHLATNVNESVEVQMDGSNSEVETLPTLPENEEQKGIAMEGGDNEDSEALIVDETLTDAAGEGNGCLPASTEEHTLVENSGEYTKAEGEGTKNLNVDIIGGADDKHDEDEIKESEETNIIEVNGDPEDLADMEDDTLDEMAGKDKQIADVAGAIGDYTKMNFEDNEANCFDTLAMENDDTYKDAYSSMKVEGEEDPGKDVEGMLGDGKTNEKDDDQGSNTGGVVELSKGLETGKNQGDSIIGDFGEKKDGLKEEENLERNIRDSAGDGEKFEEEHREWTAVAKERRIKKEHEIFVRGIGGDTKEDDLIKVFEEIGEVAEVRLHKQSLLNKNKGYAFVRFADKEHVKRALTEIKDPIIGGLSCSIGPSEDNDTLFLGNVCNTWTKEAIKQKLKDYCVEGVENITLVPDAQREGFSRGFAFLEFSCHDDAVVAYQRLQKPDVVFGHAERTAKVAFAEPLRDPDPDVMLKVKTVFVDGLPFTCDEKYVREKVKVYGEIERVVLARNMTTAKRKDFGFIHFTTHEAAVACIDGINNTGLGDGNSKTKVKARLSNPLPKTQAVKGGMAGGFRIGFSSSGGPSKPGRGVERDGPLFGQGDSARGRGSYQHGYGQSGRGNFSSASRVSGQGSRGGFRPRGELSVAHGPFVPNHVRPMSVPGEPTLGMHAGAMELFPFEGGFGRHHNQRQFDDWHAYGPRGHGTKRPSYMTDLDAGFVEPSRRPRLNYADPPYSNAAPYSSHGTQIRDTQRPVSDIRPRNYYGPPANPRPHDYYGPPAGGRPHDYYGPPAGGRPHDYYGPPSSVRPHDYYRPPSGVRPLEYHGPPENIRPHAHSGPVYRGGMRPPAYRGNPPYGGGFHH